MGRPKILFVGDHSGLHSGCQAVVEVLHEIIGSYGDLTSSVQDYDILVVNGEGSMHHDKPTFWQKMHQIRLAQHLGRKTYLVNSVWQANSGVFDDVLQKLNAINLRGVCSATDLKLRHGLDSNIGLDLSYFAELRDDPYTDYEGAVVATDVWSDNLGFVWLPKSVARDWINIDMRQDSWSSLVRGLRTAKVLIAGRHHGMYAACRAEIPFVPVQGNSHKFEDLLETAGIHIPIARTISEIEGIARWALANRAVYERLFHWMRSQRRWDFESRDTLLPSANVADVKTKAEQANRLYAMRNFTRSNEIWHDLRTTHPPHRLPYGRNAALSLLQTGDIAEGVELLAAVRASKTRSGIFPRSMVYLAKNNEVWVKRSDSGGWWELLQEASFHAEAGDFEAFDEVADKALAKARKQGGPHLASMANFLLARRLLSRNAHPHAFALRKANEAEDVPDWVRDQEDITLNAEFRRFDARAVGLWSSIVEQESWADPSLREIVLRHKSLVSDPSEFAEEIRRHSQEFPKHYGLADMFIASAVEAERYELLEDIDKKTMQVIEENSIRSLPASYYLSEIIKIKDRNLKNRSDLLKRFRSGSLCVQEIISRKSNKLAIVGNSPIELGKKRGREIDSHDIVIRFNSSKIDHSYEIDYGSRLDIKIFSHMMCQIVDSKDINGYVYQLGPWLVQRHAFHIFSPRDWEPVLAMAESGYRLAYLPRHYYSDVARYLGVSPSAGFSIAFKLRQIRKRISRSSFFGFSFTDQLVGQRKAHYFGDANPSMLHDWQREATEFEKLFE